MKTTPNATPFKLCTCCGRSYTEAEFLALPVPEKGEFGAGLRFRNCGCGSTLAIEVAETEAA